MGNASGLMCPGMPAFFMLVNAKRTRQRRTDVIEHPITPEASLVYVPLADERLEASVTPTTPTSTDESFPMDNRAFAAPPPSYASTELTEEEESVIGATRPLSPIREDAEEEIPKSPKTSSDSGKFGRWKNNIKKLKVSFQFL